MGSLKREPRFKMISRRYQLVSDDLGVTDFCSGKEQLEELKKMKKKREPMLTAEEKASVVNKQEIKGTGKTLTDQFLLGFNLEMVQSEKGR